jgi:hypothetical protein
MFSSYIYVSYRLNPRNSDYRQLHRTAIKNVIQALPFVFDVAVWLNGKTSSEPGSQLVKASLCKLSIHLMISQPDNEGTNEFSNSMNLLIHHPEYEIRQACFRALRSTYGRSQFIEN